MQCAKEVDLEAHRRVSICAGRKLSAKVEHASGLVVVEQRKDDVEKRQVALNEGNPVLHRGVAIFHAGNVALEAGQAAMSGFRSKRITLVSLSFSRSLMARFEPIKPVPPVRCELNKLFAQSPTVPSWG